jgi:hypothetical protein
LSTALHAEDFLLEGDTLNIKSQPGGILPVEVQHNVATLINNPSLSVVPNPVVYVIVSAVLCELGVADPEGRLAQEWGKDAAYISELEMLFRNLYYDPIVHIYHVDDIERVLSTLSPQNDLVFNACLGGDGYEVAQLLDKHKFEKTVGLNSKFFESSRSRHLMRTRLAANRLNTTTGITVPTTMDKKDILNEMEKNEISFPVYIKPEKALRQMDGVHTGSHCEDKNALEAYLKLAQSDSLVIESFYPGTAYRVLVAGDARDPFADAIVFPPIEDYTQKFASKPLLLRKESMQTISKEKMYDSRISLASSYNPMKDKDKMLEMDLCDLARRAYVAVHGSCYGIVTIINGVDGLRVVGSNG